LYESKRDLDRASFFWNKRVELGSVDDPWTKRARQRLDDLAQISPGYKQMKKESETVMLIKQVAQAKSVKEKESRMKAAQSLKNAKKFYLTHEYQKALGEIDKAISLDPQDKEKFALRDKIKKVVDEEQKKAQEAAMLKEKKENAKKMREYFEYGLTDYQRNNLEAARLEFNKIIELTASPQKD
jgi:tetratricopeptide (TPR) repeat protein